MQHDLSQTAHLATKEIFLLFYSVSEDNILRTYCQKYFSPHLNCHRH